MKAWLIIGALHITMSLWVAATLIGLAGHGWVEFLTIELAQILGALQVALYFTLPKELK